MRVRLQTAPALVYINSASVTEIRTDTSNFSICANLGQWQNGVEKAIAYGIRKIFSAESNYLATETEC